MCGFVGGTGLNPVEAWTLSGSFAAKITRHLRKSDDGFFLKFKLCIFNLARSIILCQSASDRISRQQPYFRSLLNLLDRSVETLGLWIVTSSVTFIKSANQSSIKLCLLYVFAKSRTKEIQIREPFTALLNKMLDKINVANSVWVSCELGCWANDDHRTLTLKFVLIDLHWVRFCSSLWHNITAGRNIKSGV